jgi:hypothetical protein
MKRLALLVLLAVLSFPAALLAQAGGTMAAPPAQAGKMEKGEAHPEIHAALQHLRQAKEILQRKAARDFEGHRKQAVESIEQAEEHLRQALEADKKQ